MPIGVPMPIGTVPNGTTINNEKQVVIENCLLLLLGIPTKSIKKGNKLRNQFVSFFVEIGRTIVIDLSNIS